MYDYRTGGWDFELMERLGIPVSLFTQDIMASGQIGRISKNVCEELNIEPTPVLAVAAHDTASAVVSVPLPHEQAAYISSGTWSILGTEVDSPVIDLKGLKYNFANEGGLQGRIRFSRNIMGLWINQELQRGFELEGRQYTFAQMEDMARHAGRFTAYLDPDDELFYEPGNMPGKIIGYCAKTGQRQPESDGEVIRVVMEGLAFKYRYCLEQMEDLVSKKFDVLNIIGGGSKDGLLSQLTADCCGKPVYAGPSEATVLGNAMAQFITLHAVKDLDEARELIRDNYPANIYYPVHTGEWAAPFESFVRFIESGRP